MPKGISFLSIVILVSLGVWATMARRPAGAVYLIPQLQDIGPVDPEEQPEVIAAYRLHNDSGRAVTITETSTSCTCTEFDISHRVISSGEAADITMRVDVTGMRGRREISAQIFTDHVAFPHFEVVASVDVGTADDNATINLSLPTVTVGDAVHHEYEVPGVSLLNLSSHTMLETINVSLEIGENKRSRLVFDGHAPQKPGLYKALIVAKTDGFIEQSEIVAFIEVRNRFDVLPEGAAFGLVKQGQQADRVVRITGRRADVFRGVRLLNADSRLSLADTHLDQNVAVLTLRLNATPGDEFVDTKLQLAFEFVDGRTERLDLSANGRILSPD